MRVGGLVAVAGWMALAFPAQAGGTSAIQLTGRGVQVYRCGPGAGGLGWRLVGPHAELLDGHGKVAGHHEAGPIWLANDGSTVTGEKLAESASPAPGAVPWLILRAKSHSGAGVFATVGYIVRSQTEGGAPPVAGCAAGQNGAAARVSYSATYSFFPQ
jgi:hypothetical protein